METYISDEITSEENSESQYSEVEEEITDVESEKYGESDTTSKLFSGEQLQYEYSELELFEFNEENYIKAQMSLKRNDVDQLSDENEDDFDNFEQEASLTPLIPPIEEINEPTYSLDPTANTRFSPCVLIDYIDDKLQTCGQTKNIKNICQLVGTWQIDEKAALEYQSKGIPLGVCMNHFNYDQKNHDAHAKQLRKPEQSVVCRRRCLFCSKNFYFFSCGVGCKNHLWNIWEKHVQIPCIGLYTCNAVNEYQGISKRIFDDISAVRYVCYSYYESYGGHLNHRPGPGKHKSTCEQRGLHKDDISKSLELLAQWLTYFARTETEEKKN